MYLEAARYLNEEELRIHSYLQLSSSQSYLTMIEEIIIQDHWSDICDEVRTMLNRTDYESS